MLFPAKRIAVLPRRFPAGMPMADGYAPAWWMDFVNRKHYYNRQHATAEQIIAALGGSFTRSSTAYSYDPFGMLISGGSNVLRRDYDPVTLTSKGILLEGARTNLLFPSVGFIGQNKEQGGVGSNAVVTDDYAAAPDGTNTASRLQLALNGGTTSGDVSSLRIGSFAVVNGTAYVGSIWIKSNTGASQNLSFSVGGSEKQIVASTVWTRVSDSYTAIGTSMPITVKLRGARTPANNNIADVLIWGGQLEAGSFASSYIPTTSASATRAADVLTFPTSPWFNESAGTFFAEFGPYSSVPGSRILGGTNPTGIIIENGTGIESYNGTSAVTKSSVLVVANTNKGIIAYNASGRVITAAGATPGTSAGLMVLGATLYVGGSSSAASAMFGHIRKVGYWPFRVTDAELQRITT